MGNNYIKSINNTNISESQVFAMQFAFKKILLFLVILTIASSDAEAQEYPLSSSDRLSASIYVYNRINEDQYADTNIRQEQFIAHLDEIETNNYTVKSTMDIVKALKSKESLPDNTISMTFDGGYKSFIEIAYPLLEKRNIPYTVFITTDHIDSDNPQYLSWPELKKIAKSDLSTIGLMPSSYKRIYFEDEQEIRRLINKAITRYREELGSEPELFAYPFGEHNKKYRDIVKASGFKAAFAQQSSIVSDQKDLFSLPRFAMTETFGNVARFRLTASALPLGARILSPESNILSEPLQSVRLQINENIPAHELKNISCFISGSGKAKVTIEDNHIVEATASSPIINQRIRINCTLPLPTSGNLDDKRWRWFGSLFIYPQNDKAESLEARLPKNIPN